jgi:hypothetical protein
MKIIEAITQMSEMNSENDIWKKLPILPVLRRFKDAEKKRRDWDERNEDPKDNDTKNMILKTIIEVGASEAFKLAGAGMRSAVDALRRHDPGWVLRQIYMLAQRNRGEVTLSQVTAELSVSESMAMKVLKRLIEERVCHAEALEGSEMTQYIFPGILRKYVRYCRYCGSHFRATDVGGKCPNCLAPL